MFLMTPGGWHEFLLGPLLPTGMTRNELLADLLVNGSVLPNGGLAFDGGGPYLWVVSGDFDNDGMLAVGDIDRLTGAIREQTNDVNFDLNEDWQINAADHQAWVKMFRQTYYGDADLDGQFDSSDLILVFQAGKYETSSEASWQAGDWSGNGEFTSDDLVVAFEDGGYEAAPRAAVAVPEPAGWGAWYLPMAVIVGRLRKCWTRFLPLSNTCYPAKSSPLGRTYPGRSCEKLLSTNRQILMLPRRRPSSDEFDSPPGLYRSMNRNSLPRHALCQRLMCSRCDSASASGR
jgi:hypothetical protein